MSDAVKGACLLMEPLGRAHLKEVLDTRYLSVDETPIKVQDRRKKGTTFLGYYWVYFNSLHQLVYFDYRQGRGRDGPLEILQDFTGYLQSDAYAAYDIFETRPGVTLLGCMAHARRMYTEALDSDTELATYVLEQMQLLYAIEKQIKDMSAEHKKDFRQERSVPLLQDLGIWMKEKYTQLKAPSTGIGKALAYSIKRWDRLSRYTEDGFLAIDNNPIERSIRAVAMGKRNYLFCGSHAAAGRAAMIYSLFGTCKLHGINPHEWLTDILTRLPGHPINRISELLPQHWKR